MSLSRNIKEQIKGMSKSKKTQRVLLEKAEELKLDKVPDETLIPLIQRHLEESEDNK
jgi:hypothetical protein